MQPVIICSGIYPFELLHWRYFTFLMFQCSAYFMQGSSLNMANNYLQPQVYNKLNLYFLIIQD